MKAVQDLAIQDAFRQLWNRLAGNCDEILLPLLAALKAIKSNPEQEQEYIELEQNIQELKMQNHMLSRVLSKGGMDSALFIQKRNQIDSDIEESWRKQRLLQIRRTYDQEVKQTEYLLTIFRNRPVYIEHYNEELFLLIVEMATVYPDGCVMFWLKNGLELTEHYRRGA